MSSNSISGFLELTISSGKDLRRDDGKVPKSPFVKIRFGSLKTQTHGPSCEDAATPTWNQNWTLPVFGMEETLIVKVRDGKKKIGDLQLSLDSVYAGEEVADKELELSNKRGSVVLSVRFHRQAKRENEAAASVGDFVKRFSQRTRDSLRSDIPVLRNRHDSVRSDDSVSTAFSGMIDLEDYAISSSDLDCSDSTGSSRVVSVNKLSPKEMAQYHAVSRISSAWEAHKLRKRLEVYFHPEYSAIMKTRVRIVREIYDSERVYVTRLNIVVQRYKFVMARRAKLGLNDEDIRKIFLNIQVIFNYHKQFLIDLEGEFRRNWPTLFLGPLFEKLLPFLMTYSEYITGYDEASRHLFEATKAKSALREFLEATRKHCQGLGLSDLLIMPVQRIPRYILLLKDLLKKTPAHHRDIENLQHALAKMEETAAQLNERKRAAENTHKLLQLQEELHIEDAVSQAMLDPVFQPGRQYLKEGHISIVQLNELQEAVLSERTAILLSDCIVLAKSRGPLLQGLSVKEAFTFSGTWVEDLTVVDNPALAQFPHTFKLCSMGSELRLEADNESEKKAWMNAITDAIKLFSASRRKRRSRQKSVSINPDTADHTQDDRRKTAELVRVSLKSPLPKMSSSDKLPEDVGSSGT